MITQVNSSVDGINKSYTVNTKTDETEAKSTNTKTDESEKSIFDSEQIKEHTENNKVEHGHSKKCHKKDNNDDDNLLDKLVKLLERLLKNKDAEKTEKNEDKSEKDNTLIKLLEKLIKLLLGDVEDSSNTEETDNAKNDAKSLISQFNEAIA